MILSARFAASAKICLKSSPDTQRNGRERLNDKSFPFFFL